MTGWIIRTVNEADRMNIKLFRELLAALNEKVIVLENDIERLDRKISELNKP